MRLSSFQFDSDAQRILVAERSSMQCELLARALGSDGEFRIVGTASDSTEALRLLHQLEPLVAVISADMQDGPSVGLDVIAQVRAKNWRTRSVALLDRSDPELVVEAFRNGARGVFFRAQPYELFLRCLRTIAQGQVWVNTNEMNYLLEALTSQQSPRLVNGNRKILLTARESEVAQLVTEGLTNREIANKLGLSEHTIKNYIFRVFDKAGVSSRVGLVLYAMSRREQMFGADNGNKNPGR
jgi:two-component system, NarL family, nitrate/nitrite response regulator NarL